MAEMFCDECMMMVDACVSVVRESVQIRGVDVMVENEYPVCPVCGIRIADAECMDRNLRRAYDAYREIEGIPSPDRIRSFRDAAGLSQRQLALLLGVGVASLQRYEAGSLPTRSHADLLKRAFDPGFLRARFRDIEATLSDRDREDISWGVDAAFGSGWDDAAYRSAVMGLIPLNSPRFTGGVEFSEGKLRETLVYFAECVRDLYKTKLNKVLFYLDFSMQRDRGRGFTGLRYARLTYGPVPDGYEGWMPAFVDGISLYYEECDNGGQIIRPLRSARMDCFSREERAQLDAVVDFANSFSTTKELSQASHEEDAWMEVRQGCLISYSYAETLKGVRRVG